MHCILRLVLVRCLWPCLFTWDHPTTVIDIITIAVELSAIGIAILIIGRFIVVILD